MYKPRKLVCVIALLAVWGVAGAETIDDLRALVNQGRSADAYQTAKKYPELLGMPEFDYLFGIAAVDAGKASEGVLALERFVIARPNDPAGRLELARGYFALGDDRRARDEFEAVSRLKPPPEVEASIQRYLDAIRLRESRYKTSSSLYVEAGGGYDTNVNGGVGDPTLQVPVFGTLTVGPNSLNKRDGFAQVGVGGSYNRPFAPGTSWFVAGQLDAKAHGKEDAFDTATASVGGGISYYRGQNQFRGSGYVSNFNLDGSRYRLASGVTGEWRRQLAERAFLSLAPQWVDLKYRGDNEVRDARLALGTANLRMGFKMPANPALSVSLSGGRESNRRDRDDLSRDIYGFGLELALSFGAKWGVFGLLGYEHSSYRAPDPILSVTRRDEVYSGGLGAIYLIDRNWSVRGEYAFTRNDSNLSLFDYRRHLTSIKLRYDYK